MCHKPIRRKGNEKLNNQISILIFTVSKLPCCVKATHQPFWLQTVFTTTFYTNWYNLKQEYILMPHSDLVVLRDDCYHVSGLWIQSTFSIPFEKNNMICWLFLAFLEDREDPRKERLYLQTHSLQPIYVRTDKSFIRNSPLSISSK